ncbi:DUF3080 family protein [Alteromonadaceae bacterium M269]|nr:DUF3080 family protein [Alteromonadaceae bacterium M269]
MKSRVFNFRFLVPICAWLGLLGCSQQTELESSLETYAKRMANILEVDAIEIETPTLSRPKDALPRKVDIPEIKSESISLITLSKLNQCGLGPLIAQRNTSLGKVQLPSTRLKWEYEFSLQLKTCSQQELEPSVQALITEIAQNKENLWQPLWGYFFQTSEPIRQAFQQNLPLIQGSNDGLLETKAALDYLKTLKATTQESNSTININELENHLQQLSIYKLPAATWRTQLFLERNLNSLTQWLKNNFDLQQCNNNPASQQKAKYLRNVFELFFINKIQPIGSTLNSYIYEINPATETLIESESITPEFKEWIRDKSDSENYRQAMREHINYWQQLFKSCEFSPGKQ